MAVWIGMLPKRQCLAGSEGLDIWTEHFTLMTFPSSTLKRAYRDFLTMFSRSWSGEKTHQTLNDFTQHEILQNKYQIYSLTKKEGLIYEEKTQVHYASCLYYACNFSASLPNISNQWPCWCLNVYQIHLRDEMRRAKYKGIHTLVVDMFIRIHFNKRKSPRCELG